MIFINQRKKLVNEYRGWLKNNPDVVDSPENIMAFLVIHNLLDEDKVDSFVRRKDRAYV